MLDLLQVKSDMIRDVLQAVVPQPSVRGEHSHALAIKSNNACCRESCAVCGCDTKPPIPYAIFLDESYAPVCIECAERIEPHLAWMFNTYYAAHSMPY